MKGIEIVIDDIKLGNTFDMTMFVVKIIAFSKNLSLSKTEIQALSYLIINGLSKKSKEELVETKLLKTYNATANLISSFRKYGIIVKHPFGERFSPEFSFNLEDFNFAKISLLVKK